MNLPSEKDEQWRYTNISNIDIDKLVHKNGSITIEESKNVEIHDLDKIPKKYHLPYYELKNKIDEIQQNGKKGLVIIARDQAEVKIKKTAFIGRIFVFIENDSTLKLTEEVVGNDLNANLDMFVINNNSKLYYNYVQKMDGNYDFSTKIFELNKNSKLRSTFAVFGSNLSRTNIITNVNDEGSDAEINCSYISSDKQHIDINTITNHNKNDTKNKITAKGILLNSSSSIVRGLIRIEKHAFKSASMFESHSLIEGDHCTSNSIPSLQIENNDVICKHASSTGKIDESQLYYLTSRGLNEKEARNLLLIGYLDPIIKKSSLYDECKKIIGDKLSDKYGC